MQKIHSKGGRWSNLNSDSFDIIYVFLPIANNLLFVLYLIGYHKEKTKTKIKYTANNFFNIKK